jgi:hypothetical protein
MNLIYNSMGIKEQDKKIPVCFFQLLHFAYMANHK